MIPKVGKAYRSIKHTTRPIFTVIDITTTQRYYHIKTRTVYGYPNVVMIQLVKKRLNKTWNELYELVPEGEVLAKIL